jgi:hypothetical protein
MRGNCYHNSVKSLGEAESKTQHEEATPGHRLRRDKNASYVEGLFPKTFPTRMNAQTYFGVLRNTTG